MELRRRGGTYAEKTVRLAARRARPGFARRSYRSQYTVVCQLGFCPLLMAEFIRFIINKPALKILNVMRNVQFSMPQRMVSLSSYS